MQSDSRNQTVDALRALAALAVCLFHFTSGDHFRSVSYLRPVGAYGVRGIEVFFVISGFIVPYAMLRGGYTLADWPRFMVKRLVRLEPPYFASIGVILALALAASMVPGYRGAPLTWKLDEIAAHFAYLNGLLGMPWLNIVYWSLAIEFQFYFLISLTLPAFLAAASAVRLGALAGLVILSALMPWGATVTIIPNLPYFAAGLLTFLVAARLLRPATYWPALAALGVWIAIGIGPVEAAATVLPAAIIATVRLPRVRVVAWLGAISYSVYLLHVPIGSRVMNLAARLPAGPWAEVAAIAVAFAASIGAAAILYYAIERPSRRVAARIDYVKEGGPGVPLSQPAGSRII